MSLQLYLGKVAIDAAMTSGSGVITTTVAGASVGDYCDVLGAGPSGATLVGVVKTVGSGTITLWQTAGTSVTDATVTVWKPYAVGRYSLSGEVSSLTNQPSLTFQADRLRNGSIPAAGQPVLVLDLDLVPGLPSASQSGDIFGGSISDVQITQIPGNGNATFDCNCVSWEQIAARRGTGQPNDISGDPLNGTFSGMAAGAVFQFIANLLVNDISAVSVVTGPTIDSIKFDYTDIASAFDSICQASSDGTNTYIWRADCRRNFYFELQTTNSAPWNISNSDALTGVTYSRTLEKFANSATVTPQNSTGDTIDSTLVRTYNNTASIDERSGVEGGTGYHEVIVAQGSANASMDANTLAQSVATVYGIVPATVQYSTFRSGLRAGHLQTIVISDIGVSGTFLIDSVSLSMSNGKPVWQVHAVAGALIGDWRTALANLASGKGFSSIAGGGSSNEFFTDAIVADHISPDLANGFNHKVFLVSATPVTVDNLIFTGGTISVGQNFTLAVYQDATGGRPDPIFDTDYTGTSGTAIATDPLTISTYYFRYDGTDFVLIGFAAGSGGSSTYIPPPDAPNIASASCSAYYGMFGNDSVYGLQGTINLPTTDPDYAHLKEIDITASFSSGSSTPVIALYSWSGSTVTFKGDCTILQRGSSDSVTLTFVVKNEAGAATASPHTETVSVQASAVTGFTSAAETGARYVVDADKDRLPHLTVSFVPILNGGQVPQNVTYWISDNNGTSYTWIGWQPFTIVGQTISVDRLAPGTAQTWKVAAAAGAIGGEGGVKVTSLPSGAVASSGFSVAALPTPAASNGITATVGAFSYEHDVEGRLFGYIAPWSYTDPTGTNTDFFVRVTVQDIDASHNPIGPEKLHGGTQITGSGNSHVANSEGLPITLSGQAGERFKIYVANRISQGNEDFTDTATNTLQSVPWSGGSPADHFDVMFGALPAGEIDLTRSDPATVGKGMYVGSDSLNVTNDLSNAALNGTFDTDIAGWSIISGAAVWRATDGDTTPGCAQLTATPAANVAKIAESDLRPVRPGDLWFASARASLNFYAPTFGDFVLALQTFDAAGAAVSGSFAAVTVTGPSSAYQTLKLNYTVPATSATMRLFVYAQNPGTTCVWFVDNVLLRPVTVSDTLGPAAVVAINMAANSITLGNAAIAANTVVDNNVVSVGVPKLIAGSVVFSGNVALSRGSGNPVIVLDNTGMFLYGVASGTSGLTSSPYVAIQAGGIGVFSSASGQSVTISGGTVNLWTVNGNTGSPYLTVGAGGLILQSTVFSVTVTSSQIQLLHASGASLTITTSNLVLAYGSYSTTVTATSVTLASSSSQLQLTSSSLTFTQGSNTVSMDASQLFVALSGSQTTITGGNIACNSISCPGGVAMNAGGGTGTINFGSSFSTSSASSGSASAIPGNPQAYITVLINGSARKIAAWNP